MTNTPDFCACTSTTLFPGRGFVYMLSAYKPGLYAVAGLSGLGTLITAVRQEETDIVLPRQSINGQRIIYTMGRGYGQITIQGELLLCAADGLLHKLTDWFEANRVSVSKNSCSISVKDRGLKMYATGMVIGQPDPVYNTQQFMIAGVSAQPALKKGGA